MNTAKATAMLAGALAMSLTQLQLNGGTCIITDGYDPVVASRADSSTSESSGTALTTGTISTRANAAVAIEARFRTWDESPGARLVGTKLGIMVTFR